MTPVDDLHVGQWIAVVGHVEQEEADDPWSQMFGGRRKAIFDGKPLKILAISLPFICVTDGYNRAGLDMREVRVKKLSKSYVEAMSLRSQVRERVSDVERRFGVTLPVTQDVDPAVKQQKEEPKSTEGMCPICGHKLISRKYEGDSAWVFACKECGFEGTRGSSS